MQYFLIVYNRESGESVIEDVYPAAHRGDAMKARFNVEARYADRPELEIVVLGAESEDGLHHTHARYFTSAKDLLRRAQLAGRS